MVVDVVVVLDVVVLDVVVDEVVVGSVVVVVLDVGVTSVAVVDEVEVVVDSVSPPPHTPAMTISTSKLTDHSGLDRPDGRDRGKHRTDR